MIAERIEEKSGFVAFAKVCKDIYKGNPYYRGTDGSIEKLLLKGSKK